MARYEPGQAVEQFGDVRYDEDLVAVRKQSCLFPLSGLREGDDPAAVYSTGNALALVNTKVREGGKYIGLLGFLGVASKVSSWMRQARTDRVVPPAWVS